jgi:hypothetical protein
MVKQLFVALAAAVAVAAAAGQASAQGGVVLQPNFVGGGTSTYRGPFPGFKYSQVPLPNRIQTAQPTAIYSVNQPGGVITPSAYLGNNLGASLSQTYQTIVQTNSILSLSSNSGQFGNFGNLGSQGVQGGQAGQVGNAGNIGGLLGGIGGAAGVGGKGGAGGAVGAVGALGSRYYGI